MWSHVDRPDLLFGSWTAADVNVSAVVAGFPWESHKVAIQTRPLFTHSTRQTSCHHPSFSALVSLAHIVLSATTPNSVHPVQQSRKTQLGHLAAEREGWSQLYSFYTSALAYKCTLRWSPPNIGAQSKYLFIPSVQCNANWDWWMVWPRLLLLLVLWQFPFEMSCKLS